MLDLYMITDDDRHNSTPYPHRFIYGRGINQAYSSVSVVMKCNANPPADLIARFTDKHRISVDLVPSSTVIPFARVTL